MKEGGEWPEEDYTDGFFRYRGYWYHLADFTRCSTDGWHGALCDSFYSGVLIRLSSDGEFYQVATFTS